MGCGNRHLRQHEQQGCNALLADPGLRKHRHIYPPSCQTWGGRHLRLRHTRLRQTGLHATVMAGVKA